jgi:GntR family transcriptional regulator of vanillate catabolism
MAETPLLNRLRQMILEGRLAPGERVTEAGLAERLGLSRTPIRNVLPALAAEGYLKPVGRRGFAVAEFNDAESTEALELRAVLEGQAGRMLARKGASPEVLADLDACLAEGDALFGKGVLDADDKVRYGEMNARFHDLIIEAAGAPILQSLVDRLNRVPFVAPGVIVVDHDDEASVYKLLYLAHGHHHAIVEAIRDRDSARVEMLFREHANAQRQSTFELRSPL